MEILREAEKRGLDIIDILVNAIDKSDPSSGIKIRIELAKKYLSESKDYLGRNDAVQASEKAYKAVEEVIKALTEKYNTPEYLEAIKAGKWFTYLLQKASNTLALTLGDWVAAGWAAAYSLHVWGFHEAKLTVNDMVAYMRVIEDTVNKAIELLSK